MESKYGKEKLLQRVYQGVPSASAELRAAHGRLAQVSGSDSTQVAQIYQLQAAFHLAAIYHARFTP
jgi:hypothetical protein